MNDEIEIREMKKSMLEWHWIYCQPTCLFCCFRIAGFNSSGAPFTDAGNSESSPEIILWLSLSVVTRCRCWSVVGAATRFVSRGVAELFVVSTAHIPSGCDVVDGIMSSWYFSLTDDFIEEKKWKIVLRILGFVFGCTAHCVVKRWLEKEWLQQVCTLEVLCEIWNSAVSLHNCKELGIEKYGRNEGRMVFRRVRKNCIYRNLDVEYTQLTVEDNLRGQHCARSGGEQTMLKEMRERLGWGVESAPQFITVSKRLLFMTHKHYTDKIGYSRNTPTLLCLCKKWRKEIFIYFLWSIPIQVYEMTMRWPIG